MSRRDDRFRLQDMLNAAREARSFATGRAEDDLAVDWQLTLALLKSIEIIGEAAARTSGPTQDKYAEFPWADIIGMRNRLIHVYFDIDLALLWDTVTVDLPALIATLEGVLDQ